MFVIKRDGKKENVQFDKIHKRILKHCKDLKNVDNVIIAQKVIQGLFDGVSSRELDKLAIETAYSMSTKHPEYDKLATRLAISALHKDTDSLFSSVIEKLYHNKDNFGNVRPSIAEDVYHIVKKNAHILDSAIDYSRDFNFDYFGFKTLERSYLLKLNSWEDDKLSSSIAERPQHLWMRVAVGIHKEDIDAALETYEMLSTFKATHATPTLFNSGTVKNQMSSCFLQKMKADSIEGIYDTLKESALISQSAGGIGISIHNIRSKGSPIYGTGGVSNGIVPMLKNFNETARFVDQGGGKRKGSAAIYLEPWHPDVFDFLDLRKNNGKEELRCRDLNLALWVPDLFLKRVEENKDWTLMDPNKCPGLSDVYGDEFVSLYEKYESESKGDRVVKAQDLWLKIIESQIETGQPYICAKDAGNKKSNQKNIGTIYQSNLCAEIFEHTAPNEVAVCNLASISLPFCVEGKKNKKTFNFTKLQEIVTKLVKNLNNVIDVEYYPIKEAKYSNLKNRPVGIGIQGLADIFALMRLPWESEGAKKLNKEIAECMYYAAIKASCELAKVNGPYETFKGSPASEGLLQFDLWGVQPSDKYDWANLKEDVKKYGLRNSLILSNMPTASTSQIMGNTECFEPITSNIYKRATLSGEFIQINKYLIEDLIDLNLWNDEMRQTIIASNGSIQNIQSIPDEIKALYKTVWEIPQRIIIDMAADRGAFTCQSQSMNLYFKEPNVGKITSALFYGWKKGLKTLVYYTRTTAASDTIKFTIDKQIEENVKKEKDMEDLVCSLDNPESCMACGS